MHKVHHTCMLCAVCVAAALILAKWLRFFQGQPGVLHCYMAHMVTASGQTHTHRHPSRQICRTHVCALWAINYTNIVHQLAWCRHLYIRGMHSSALDTKKTYNAVCVIPRCKHTHAHTVSRQVLSSLRTWNKWFVTFPGDMCTLRDVDVQTSIYIHNLSTIHAIISDLVLCAHNPLEISY